MARRRSALVLSVSIALLAAGLPAAPAAAGRASRPAARIAPAGATSAELWIAPPVDLERARAEDAAAPADRPLRRGLRLRAGVSPATHGTWTETDSGDLRWRLRVRSPGALWLGLGFGTYRMQEGGRLTVADPAGRVVHGPYTAADIRSHGQLWLPPVPGDTAVLELIWPRELAGQQPDVHLGRLTHGYRAWAGTGIAGALPPEAEAAVAGITSGFCNVGINCPLGQDWQTEKLSVVQLIDDRGTEFCTGALVNNTAQDCRPYVLTARHCLEPFGGGSIDPAAVTFRFNYEQSGCDSGIAPTSQLIVGSTLVATWTGSDFMLLEMDESPPENFAHWFAGWDRRDVAVTETWSIHHPSQDPRKISFNNDPVVAAAAGIHFGRITEWEVGTTEPASSGAPIFNQDHRLVGQLFGGLAACDVFDFDEFGKLTGSWNGPAGGTSAQRLAGWLDPGGSGVQVLDGLDPAFCATPQARLARRGLTLIDHEDGRLDPGEHATIAVELVNQGTLPATGVSGTMTIAHPDVTVVTGQSTWPDLGVEGVGSSSPHFRLRAEPGLTCGDTVQLNFAFQSNEGTWNDTVTLQTGTQELTEVFADDVESGDNGWTSMSNPGFPPNSWTRTTDRAASPTHSWFVPNIASRSDTRLVMPAIQALPAASVLRFTHYVNSVRNLDGAVLEYTTNDGSSWNDAGALIASGGYNSTINPIGGSPFGPDQRPGWSGDLGSFQDVEVDLSTLAGQNVQFRWRFATDLNDGDEGWYVDDIRVEQIGYRCDPSRVDSTSRCNGEWPDLPGGRPMPCGQNRTPPGGGRTR